METKDLVLLMFMPVMLIGLIFYINNNPIITGAAVKQQQESNKIGEYFINPSTSAKVNYDLNDYNKIKEQLDFIMKCSSDKSGLEPCMNDAEIKESEFSWELGCDRGIEKILYDLAEFYQDCFDSEDDECICRKSLDISKDEIQKYNLYQEQPYNLELSQDIFSKKIEIKSLDPVKISYKIGSNDRSIWYPKKYIIAYRKDMLYGLNMIFQNEISGSYYSFGPVKEVLLYKHKINDVKSVDFIKQPDKEFFYPNDAKIESQNIHDCSLKDKNIFRFCATKKDSKIMAYDEISSRLEEKPITIKFAAYIKEFKAPPPVKSLKAEDKLKAENAVVLRWSKVKKDDGSEVSDLDHYNIYCSKSKFTQDDATKEINLKSLNPSMAAKSDKNYDEWALDLNKCANEGIKDAIDYYFAVTAVGKSKKESKAFVYATATPKDDLSPGPQKIFLVNSNKDKAEMESSACMELPAEKSGNIGSISAGFLAPEKNEDGITLVSQEEQLSYYLYFSKENPITKGLDDCGDSKKCVKLSFVPKENIVFNKLGPYNLEEGKNYCFTIVAADKNGNVITNLPYEFKKPQQWIDLEERPIMKGFFDENGKISYG